MNRDPFLESIIQAAKAMEQMQNKRYEMMERDGRRILVECTSKPKQSTPDSYETFFAEDIVTQTPKHDICSILQEPIEEDSFYHVCSKCEQSVSSEAMYKWWKTCVDKNTTPTCPSCRKQWANHCLYLHK